MPPFETILFERRDGIAHISLNRPDALNAYNVRMRDDFCEALSAVQIDQEIDALIISGQGRAFCAGADLTEFGTAPSQVIARRVRWQRDVWAQLNGLRIPAIAAIHGYCIGSGVEIALFCDIRIANKDAVFAMPEVQLGMIPAAGGSQTLPRNCRTSAALDLLLTGRRLDASEALKLGLITRIVPQAELDETALELAMQLALLSGSVTANLKQAMRQGLDFNLKAGLELETRLARLAYMG